MFCIRMEFFEKAKTVRLKSVHGKYLWANDHSYKVFQCKEPNNVSAQWRVEREPDSKVIRLKSCYNTYLTATDELFLLGMTGKKVVHSKPSRLDAAVEWEPIRENSRQIKLMSYDGKFLRANRTDKTATYPWKNSITHDCPTRRQKHQEYLLWEVETVWEKTTSSVSNESSEKLASAHKPYVPSPNGSSVSNGGSHPSHVRHRNEVGTSVLYGMLRLLLSPDLPATPPRAYNRPSNRSSDSDGSSQRSESPEILSTPHKPYVSTGNRRTSSSSSVSPSDSISDDDVSNRSTSANSSPSPHKAYVSPIQQSRPVAYSAPKAEGRTIYYTLADSIEQASYVNDDSEWLTFSFRGHSLSALKKELQKLLEIDEEILLCARQQAGTFQLKLPTLPPNNADMHIIVAKASSSSTAKSGANVVSAKNGSEQSDGGVNDKVKAYCSRGSTPCKCLLRARHILA
ncbi:hypothetical protein R1sor_026797 [Riccia sorocarpa]|uniref:DUF569 domain-containing protein n=1 Tax=Riccia sorocarpa TaxID=122646 RepID=A0ABD3GI67_9MARC